MGNNIACNMVEIDSVRLKISYGLVKGLCNIRHVIDLKRNLVSLGMLDHVGYVFKLQKGMLKVSKVL